MLTVASQWVTALARLMVLFISFLDIVLIYKEDSKLKLFDVGSMWNTNSKLQNLANTEEPETVVSQVITSGWLSSQNVYSNKRQIYHLVPQKIFCPLWGSYFYSLISLTEICQGELGLSSANMELTVIISSLNFPRIYCFNFDKKHSSI